MRKADELLQLFLNRIGQSEGAPYVELFRGWREIVGDRIADHAEPVDVRGPALIVEADHPGWVQMLMLSQGSILRQLKRRYPELSITGMHIRVAGDRAAARMEADSGNANELLDQGPERTASPPSQNDADALNRLDDAELRNSLERIRQSLDTDEKDR